MEAVVGEETEVVAGEGMGAAVKDCKAVPLFPAYRAPFCSYIIHQMRIF